MADDQPIHLVFDSRLRVAGEVLDGEVHLNFPILMKSKVQEVHVKLRGSVYTYVAHPWHRPTRTHEPARCRRITRQSGQSTMDRWQTVELVRQTTSLWTQGSDVYPPPESHILKIPFQFTLPNSLLPSFHYSDFHRRGKIEYFVEVVGKRSGLHFDKRVTRAFALVPPYDTGALLRLSLVSGWDGEMKTIVNEKGIRRGIWGEFSHVKVTVCLLLVRAVHRISTDTLFC